jgi:ankyrin repeat protein
VFDYLLTLVRYGEQLDHIYHGPYGTRQTLLSLCVTNGYYKGLIQLIKAGANMNIVSVNEHGETRNNLMAAVDQAGRFFKDRKRIMIQRCIHYLARFYDVNDQNSRGQTALMFANRAGNTDLAKILLELGADPNIVDMNDKK